MNENIEKVLAALDGFRMSDEMTYSAYSVLYDEISLLDDLLKAQEPHVITKDDFSRCDDFGYIPAVFEPIDMKNFLNWEWSLITQNALSRDDGRYWSGLPSDEQREAVKYE